MQKLMKQSLCFVLMCTLIPVSSALPVLANDTENAGISAESTQTDTGKQEYSRTFELTRNSADEPSDTDNSDQKNEKDEKEKTLEEKTELFLKDPEVQVDLIDGDTIIDTLYVRPRFEQIDAADIELPEGVKLKSDRKAYDVPADDKPLKLQATSSSEVTTLKLKLMDGKDEVGTLTLTRMVPADEENQVAFDLSRLVLPEGYEVKEKEGTDADEVSDDVEYVRYGKTREAELEVEEAKPTSTLNVTLILQEALENGQQAILKQIALTKEKSEDGTEFKLDEMLPADLKLKNADDNTQTIPAGQDSGSAQVQTVLSEDAGLVNVLYTDEKGKQLATAVYSVPTEDHKQVSINLNEVSLDLPVGYTPVNDVNMVEVVPGQIVHANLPMTDLIKESLLRVEYFDDGVPVGDQILKKSVPSLNGTVSYPVKDLAVPEGYKLTGYNKYSTLTGKYGEESYQKLQVEPSDIEALIEYLDDQSGDVIETQPFSSKDGLLLEDDLKLPASYALKKDFKDIHYSQGQVIDIPVVLDENAPEPSLFSITYKDAGGTTAGTQKKTITPVENQATLTSDQLDLPAGYALEKPFEDVSAKPGEAKDLTINVMRDDTNPNEAVFSVIFTDESGNPVGRDDQANKGNGDLTLDETDVHLPPGYKLKDTFETVTGTAGTVQEVKLVVVKDDGSSGSNSNTGSKEAIFKITYKDTDGNTVDSQTVTFKGDTGSASLEKSDLKVPSGYKIKGSYTAPTCSYGSTLSIEIKVEKDGSSSSSSGSDTTSKDEAILEVVYYVQDGSSKKNVKKETFKSDTTGEKGKEYIFVKDKTYTIKAPNGYALAGGDVADKVSVDFGYSGTLEVQVKLTDVNTAAQTDRAALSTLFGVSLAGFVVLAWYSSKSRKAAEK